MTKQLDMNEISYGNDPFMGRIQPTGSKYDKLFVPLKPGMCLRVPEELVQSISKALHTWIKTRGMENVMVRTNNRYPGAKAGLTGRIWLLPKEDSKVHQIKKVA